MLKRYTESAVDLILPFETWKQPVRNAIQIDRQRKFDLIFDDTQRRHISSRIAGINLDELMNLTSDT
jgi:hypothetical protein